MPLILPGNVASATADVAYSIANSCRFNDADAARVNRDLVTATSRQKFTFSFWFKRCTISHQFIITNAGSTSHIKFDANHNLDFMDEDGNIRYITDRVFRDVSAWYSIIIAVDTTQGVAGNRVKIYVNGTQETSFSTSTAPDQNYNCTFNTAVNFKYASYDSDADFALDAYLAEVVFIDGLQLAPTSFGEFDEDSPTIWKPVDPSDLTFGTNGHWLDFEDSANLGNDANGGTDWTESNLDATDSATDTPTNNFCTMNPLVPWSNPNTFSQGNCMLSGPASAWQLSSGTMGFSKGKWFWEVRYEGGTVGNYHTGVIDETANNFGSTHGQAGVTTLYNGEGGEIFTGSDGLFTAADYGTIDTSSDVLGVACNFDDGQISYYINGSIVVTNHALDSTTNNKNTLFPLSVQHGSSQVTKYNFGGCSGFTVSSAVNDANGYGNFEYAVPSGYYSLCTKNLATYG